MIRPEDLYCRACGWEGAGVYDTDAPPPCPECREALRIDLSKWDRAPGTDVLGSEQVASVLTDEHGRPLRYTSTRDRDAKMRRMGFEPVGDKVGGSRQLEPARPKRPSTTRPFRWGSHERRDQPAA